MPPGVDAERLVPRAIEHGVIYVAGEAFFVNGAGRNLVRLSFSSPAPDRIREGVTRLAAAVREERAAPSTETDEQRADVTGQAAGSPPPHPAAP
jgi:DNA-binding transcriptional MocR family regulator